MKVTVPYYSGCQSPAPFQNNSHKLEPFLLIFYFYLYFCLFFFKNPPFHAFSLEFWVQVDMRFLHYFCCHWNQILEGDSIYNTSYVAYLLVSWSEDWHKRIPKGTKPETSVIPPQTKEHYLVKEDKCREKGSLIWNYPGSSDNQDFAVVTTISQILVDSAQCAHLIGMELPIMLAQESMFQEHWQPQTSLVVMLGQIGILPAWS